MAGRRGGDPRIGMMLAAYHAILMSVPTVREPGEHGPLTAEEIDQATEFIDRTAAEIRAERENRGEQ